eukprot:6212329-Pleurochrysis_carterae.AAC.2
MARGVVGGVNSPEACPLVGAAIARARADKSACLRAQCRRNSLELSLSLCWCPVCGWTESREEPPPPGRPRPSSGSPPRESSLTALLLLGALEAV